VKASQSLAPPGPFVSVTVTWPPGATVVVLTVSVAGDGGSGVTVTAGLVARRVKPPFGKKRNSYCPGVVGTVTVHVRVVTPVPT
jgi:hypothetical protein